MGGLQVSDPRTQQLIRPTHGGVVDLLWRRHVPFEKDGKLIDEKDYYFLPGPGNYLSPRAYRKRTRQ
jgi:hypothetical protein